MKIEHIALWVADLERMRNFYVTMFDGVASARYTNTHNQFSSFFIHFGDGARLELMSMPGLLPCPNSAARQALGLVHLAFATGSAQQVDALTTRLVNSGAPLLAAPHLTGDAYYESVVLDPEGNRVEITI